eukprot:3333255-Prymnesium_polylepis.4
MSWLDRERANQSCRLRARVWRVVDAVAGIDGLVPSACACVACCRCRGGDRWASRARRESNQHVQCRRA